MNITTTFAGGVNSMKKKTSKGRKKIEIKKIEQVSNRQVTFSKRRSGLFKKASELCILTGAEIAVLVQSPGGRVFAFGNPTADELIDRYLATTNNNNNNASTSSDPPPVREFNRHYLAVSKELEAEKKLREVIQESKLVNGGGLRPWYDQEIDGMEAEELQQYLSALMELRRKVLVRAGELMMIMKAPPLLGGRNMMANGRLGYTNDVVQNTLIHPTDVMPPPGFNFGYNNNYNIRDSMM